MAKNKPRRKPNFLTVIINSIINYDWLVKCLEAIIDYNDEFLSFVNSTQKIKYF